MSPLHAQHGEDVFRSAVFSAPQERCERVTRAVLEHVDANAPLRVLDLGCGSGQQLFHLAQALPHSALVGVDISAGNIRLAEAARGGRADAARLHFVAADYLSWHDEPFDLIVSDSTLQNIPADDATLFAKIVADLRPGGQLLVTMPYTCAFNCALYGVRWVMRGLRSPLTDALVLAAGRLLHRGHTSRETLAERLPYMYLLPCRTDSPPFRQRLEADWGLAVAGASIVPHASVGQPRHSLVVYRKRTP